MHLFLVKRSEYLTFWWFLENEVRAGHICLRDASSVHLRPGCLLGAQRGSVRNLKIERDSAAALTHGFLIPGTAT